MPAVCVLLPVFEPSLVSSSHALPWVHLSTSFWPSSFSLALWQPSLPPHPERRISCLLSSLGSRNRDPPHRWHRVIWRRPWLLRLRQVYLCFALPAWPSNRIRLSQAGPHWVVFSASLLFCFSARSYVAALPSLVLELLRLSLGQSLRAQSWAFKCVTVFRLLSYLWRPIS